MHVYSFKLPAVMFALGNVGSARIDSGWVRVSRALFFITRSGMRKSVLKLSMVPSFEVCRPQGSGAFNTQNSGCDLLYSGVRSEPE